MSPNKGLENSGDKSLCWAVQMSRGTLIKIQTLCCSQKLGNIPHLSSANISQSWTSAPTAALLCKTPTQLGQHISKSWSVTPHAVPILGPFWAENAISLLNCAKLLSFGHRTHFHLSPNGIPRAFHLAPSATEEKEHVNTQPPAKSPNYIVMC